jgi:hypothetical protein
MELFPTDRSPKKTILILGTSSNSVHYRSIQKKNIVEGKSLHNDLPFTENPQGKSSTVPQQFVFEDDDPFVFEVASE